MISKERIDKQIKDCEEILDCKSFLWENKVMCVKYNYTLDSEAQNVFSFDAILSLSKDGKSLAIRNKKPVAYIDKTAEDM